MSWTYTYKAKGVSVSDFFSDNFNHENERTVSKVIACSVKNFKEAYMAYEILDKETQTRKVIAIVCLLNFNRGEYNFGYKDMDESMGPCAIGCPEKILKLLTPLPDDETNSTKWAKEWREKCWNNVNKRKNKLKLKVGMKIKVPSPIHFTNGESLDTFYVASTQPLRLTRNENSYNRYRVRRDLLVNAVLAE
jgi:hypothetical protein